MIVTEELAVAGFVPKLPVIPAGQPEVANVTAELNPFTGVTVTVELPADPTTADAGVAPSVKLGCKGVTVNVPNFCQGPLL